MDDNQQYCYRYPRPAVTTDCVIFGYEHGQLRVLLIERGNEPFKGRWALPGGFVKMDETAEEGARRELQEETALDCSFMQQLHAYSSVDRDPRERVITIAYLALTKIQDVEGGDDASKARWFGINEVPSLAFDHDKILRDALCRLRELIHFHPIGYELLPEKFTMKDLQTLYESILGVSFDRRNFAKKMLHLDILSLDDSASTPYLYSFNLNKYNELKQRGFRLEF